MPTEEEINSKKIDELIRKYELVPHPQGCGYFRETNRNPAIFKTESNEERNLSTSIIALLKSGRTTPLHRSKSHQTIHHYQGNSNLLVHTLDSSGKVKTYKMPE